MPKLKNTTPKYCKHKASGQAVVTIAGRDHYLGPHGTKASKTEYDRLIGEWLAAGRPTRQTQRNDITIAEMAAAYLKFAKTYYRKNGELTDTIYGVKVALRWLKDLYGRTEAEDFGPLALKAIRRKLVETGLARKTVNDRVDRIRRVFKWAASEELISAAVFHSLQTVEGLRKGRTEARETAPVQPVADDIVDRTLPKLPAVVADMVRFQRLTGCRPGEVCSLRPCDLDISGDVWPYRLEGHKTEHHGRERVIFIGPKAQQILRPYLLRDKSAFCFSPLDSERKRLRARHESRVTPMSCGNRPGSAKRRKPKRTAGEQYTNDSYRRAIHRACDLAFPPPEPLARREGETKRQWRERLTERQREQLKMWQSQHRWSPNQIRHTAATEIRRQFGLEAAQVTLGHASANVTQVYAERDLARAAEIMRQVA